MSTELTKKKNNLGNKYGKKNNCMDASIDKIRKLHMTSTGHD